MNNKTIIATFIVMLLVVLLAGCSPKVEQGQVWVYTAFEDNPWDECRVTNTVLEVRNKHVRYSSSSRAFGTRETSTSISTFVFRSDRIK